MKYIILPLLDFIWALLFTLIWLIFTPFVVIVWVVWDFSFKYKFEVRQYNGPIYIEWSPYTKVPFEGRLYFKSYFHYIWNIR